MGFSVVVVVVLSHFRIPKKDQKEQFVISLWKISPSILERGPHLFYLEMWGVCWGVFRGSVPPLVRKLCWLCLASLVLALPLPSTSRASQRAFRKWKKKHWTNHKKNTCYERFLLGMMCHGFWGACVCFSSTKPCSWLQIISQVGTPWVIMLPSKTGFSQALLSLEVAVFPKKNTKISKAGKN